MKIAVTGATGFIGRNIVEILHTEGVETIAIGRSLQIGRKLKSKGIAFCRADILVPNDLKGAFDKADFLIHCAAKTGDWGSYRDFYAANVIGTENIISECRASFVKNIIYISTPSVYYSGKDRYNVTENDALPKKQFNYGRTKLIAENKLMALQKEGFKIIILRPRAVYGRYDNTLVPRILMLSGKKQIPLINEGKALVDITYIENLIDAVKCCFTASADAWNQAYNISNGNPISVRDWFSQVLEIFNRPFNPKNVSLTAANIVVGIMELMSAFPFGNKKPSMTRFSVGYMGKSLTISIEKARKKLKYVPAISNYEGFKRYREWYSSKSD